MSSFAMINVRTGEVDDSEDVQENRGMQMLAHLRSHGRHLTLQRR
jgi:hypothetical protein